MSQDQRPARIRAVAGTGEATSEKGGNESAGASAAPADLKQNAAEATAAQSSMLPGILLYLIGCAVGGAALAAMPHLLAH